MTQLATATATTSLASCVPTVIHAAQLATVPAEDHREFLSLSLAERQEIILQLEVFSELCAAAAGQLQRECKEAARAIQSMYPHLRGYSQARLYKRFILWRDGGQKTNAAGKPTGTYYAPRDWRCLVKDYNNGKGKGLPPEFIEYLVSEWAKTTRDKDAFNALRARLKRDWLAGKDIPGYGTADEWYPQRGKVRPVGQAIRDRDLPTGWSYKNLARALKRALPRKSMQQAAQGQANRLKTAWGARLKRDRSELRFMELWTIDDVRLDLQARMYIAGRGWQIVYVDALFAIDVATGCIIGWGIKPAITRDEDTEMGKAAGTKVSIDSRDVRQIVLSVIRNGLPPYLSTLLTEMATAKLSKADENGVLTLLKGMLAIDGTGMGRGQLLKSGFAEQWGRPAVKQWIEAFFRLLHTNTNNLPGTVGRRYELTRGDHKARIKYTRSMLDRATKLIDGELTPDHPLHEQLILPVLTVDEVTGVVSELVDALNHRWDHKLQGFDRVFEFQLPDGRWLPESALNMLPAAQRLGIELVDRPESPVERANRLMLPVIAEWRQIAPEVLVALHAEKRFVTAKGGRVSFTDKRLSADSLDFAAPHLHTLDKYEGAENALLAYLADDLSHIVVADAASGAHVATLQREGRVSLRDKIALDKRKGEVHREMQDELSHVRTFLGSHEREFAAMRDNNDAVLAAAAAARPERTDVPAVAQAVASEQRNALSRPPKAADIRKQQSRFARQAAIARATAADRPF